MVGIILNNLPSWPLLLTQWLIDVIKQFASGVRLDILQDFRMQSLESDHFRKQQEIEEVKFHQDPLMKRLQELQRQDLAGSLCIACEKYGTV